MSESRQYDQVWCSCRGCGKEDFVWKQEQHFGRSGDPITHYLVGMVPNIGPIHSLQPSCKECREKHMIMYTLNKTVNG